MPQEFLPLLKPENIDELKSLILEIMEDNDSKLEKIIESRQNKAVQQGEDFTIQDLNDILSEQCLQKQKIISNLSHFALSLMNTIDVLWQDNQDLEYRVKDQRDVIDEMNSHLLEMNKESEFLKNKLQMAYHDIHKIEEEKQAVEEYLSSIMVKHDNSFCMKQEKRLDKISSQEQKICDGDQYNLQQHMYFNDEQNHMEELNQQEPTQPTVQLHKREQNSDRLVFEQNSRDLANPKYAQMDLLEESVIKDSISVLRRFTLEQTLPILEESHQNVDFISKSNKFTLINQISLQIFDETKQKDLPSTTQSLARIPDIERSVIKDLKICNDKVNITIATNTEFTKTRDSQKNGQELFSMIQPSPSCTSFMLHRQNSAVMYPSLERTNSTISFVTHTTKHIQTDPHPPKLKDLKLKNTKIVEKKSIGIETSTFANNPTNKNQQQNKLNSSSSQKNEQSTSRKSFGQLLDYFTKKIVSDRIKTGNKKNDFGAFKKTKSNIQKVF